MKIATTDKKVKPIDASLIVILFRFFVTLILAKIRKIPFLIEKKDRSVMLIRCICATIGFLCLQYGIELVPLVVQNTIVNTAPFWTAILGWMFLKEKISPLEIAALFLSFGGVLMIVISSTEAAKNQQDTGN